MSPGPGRQPEARPHRSQLSLAQPGDVPAEDFDQSRGRFLQRGHAAPDGRPTRTRLSHQAKGFAAFDGEGDRVDRFKAAAELHAEVVDFEDNFGLFIGRLVLGVALPEVRHRRQRVRV